MIKHWMRNAALGLLLAAASSAWAGTTLLFSTFFPAPHPIIAKVMVPWAKDVEAATGGRVKIEFASASLAPPQGQLDMVQKGIADLSLQYAGVVPKRLQPELITELPGPGGTAVAMSRALWETDQRFFQKDRRYKGLHKLALFTFPQQEFYCLAECFSRIDQFRSAKIATTPSTSARQYGALTSGIVAGPAVRYFEVVSKGIVDAYAAVTPIEVYSFNLAPSTKGVLRMPGLNTAGSFALVVNEAKWNSLSKADRDAITRLSGPAFDDRMAVLDAASDAAMKHLAASGVKMVDASPTLTKELGKAYAFLDKDWIKEANERGIDGAAALRFYRAQLNK